ncbi:MAG TPA: TMEM175 family protein [Propionibacteriaceae bacterium]|nr:TMEM175 family protein [Propionibacteriaceae bacterium]
MASEREATADRVIIFSDGVVAIAITLLILPLTEIDPSEGANLAEVVVQNQGALFAFALSFAVIANYWTIHDDLFRPLRRHDSRLVLLNMLWLATIVFLPFPTSLIEDGLDGGFGTLYISTLLVVSVLILLIANHLTRHPELTDSRTGSESYRHLIGSAFSVGALVIALIISFFSPTGGMLALLLLFPAQLISGRVIGRASRVDPV